MRLHFHRDFEKRFKRLKKNEQKKARERIQIFQDNPFRPILHNHPLQGKYTGYRSIDITGDLRAVFKTTKKEDYWFVRIGTRPELYS